MQGARKSHVVNDHSSVPLIGVNVAEYCVLGVALECQVSQLERNEVPIREAVVLTSKGGRSHNHSLANLNTH